MKSRRDLDPEIGDGRLGLGARVRRFAVDITPLRSSRDFRLLFWSEMISESGHQVTIVAVFYQVFHLTHSAAAVGLVGAVQLLPLMLSTIGGGPLIDRHDRRKLLLLTQCAFAVTSSVLLLGAASGKPPLALIYGSVAVAAGLSGIASPTRSSMYPNMVPRDKLSSAVALNQVMWTTTGILGPAIGGIVIGRFGLAWAYGIDVITYAATIAAAIAMSPAPPKREDGESVTTGIAAIKESFAFLKGKRVLQSTFMIDLIAMIFGMPRALFPILAVTQFHRGPEAVGALFSAIAFGALAGALSAGWVTRVSRQGLAVCIAVALWGAGITAFGFTGNRLWPALLLLAFAGASDVVSAVFRGTILQSSVPDSLRGRMAGVHILVVTGGPRVGDLEAGLVAQWFGPHVSVVSGGIACMAGVFVLAALVGDFVRYRVPE